MIANKRFEYNSHHFVQDYTRHWAIYKLGQTNNLATFLQNSYELATKKNFGHLLIDLDLKTSDCLQYCSKIVEPSPSIPSDKAEVAAITKEREKLLFSSDKQIVQFSKAEIEKYIRTSHKNVNSVLCECLHNVIRGKVRIHNLKQFENIFRIGFRKRTSLDKKTSQSPIKNRFWVSLAHYSVLSCLIKLNNKMTITEDFILVPKKLYLNDQQLMEPILENPQKNRKSPQLSILNRVRPKDYDGDIKKLMKIWVKRSQKRNQTRMLKKFQEIGAFLRVPSTTGLKLIDHLKKLEEVSIDESKKLTVDKKHICVFIYTICNNKPKNFKSWFFHNFQSPTSEGRTSNQ